jgi:hypothetical protein
VMMDIEDIRRITGVSYRQQSAATRLYWWVCDHPPAGLALACIVSGAMWAGIFGAVWHWRGIVGALWGVWSDLAGNLGEAWHIGDGIGWLSPMKWGLATAVGMVVFCAVMAGIRRAQTGKWGGEE